jgi:2-C-methyl-D-erythritol 4-phosphate cytidylyltransferase
VVPAAGIGARMGGNRPKQYLELSGRTILETVLERLAAHTGIHAVLPVIRGDDPYWPAAQERLRHLPNLLPAAPGGAERNESVAGGLAALTDCGDDDLVLIHDAVRPCIRAEEITAVIASAREGDGAILGVPVADTLKRVAEDGGIEATVDRSALWRAQTPQVFPAGKLRGAVAAARERGDAATDEAKVMEDAGHRVRVVEGREDNLKVTRAEDLALARLYLESA